MFRSFSPGFFGFFCFFQSFVLVFGFFSPCLQSPREDGGLQICQFQIFGRFRKIEIGRKLLWRKKEKLFFCIGFFNCFLIMDGLNLRVFLFLKKLLFL